MEKMSMEELIKSSVSMNYMDTDLTLGLPGESREIGVKTGSKRGCGCPWTVDLNLGSESPYCDDQTEVSSTGKPSSPKAQVVGWPPVRSSRRKNTSKRFTHVKVAVDGAPYLRKVDLEMYNSYQELLSALEEMFTCFTVSNGTLNESKLMNSLDGTEYVPTYEDKDGDWMLVGDVPWKMFIESCKRLRLMKSLEAVGLGNNRYVSKELQGHLQNAEAASHERTFGDHPDVLKACIENVPFFDLGSFEEV